MYTILTKLGYMTMIETKCPRKLDRVQKSKALCLHGLEVLDWM